MHVQRLKHGVAQLAQGGLEFAVGLGRVFGGLPVNRQLRGAGMPALVIDTANRPQAGLRQLAAVLDAPYLALPRADAQRLSGVLQAALGA